MRVAELDTTRGSVQCPGDLNFLNITCGIKIVRIRSSACSSITFHLNSTLYSKVCGRVKAYQIGSPGAFHAGRALDSVYVDGISLTYGTPRQHIWTLAAASNATLCPCSTSNQTSTSTPPPESVGEDYFCDTASEESSRDFTDVSNPLWDGAGCVSACCSFNNPPWFYKQLPHATAEDMEMRVCADQNRANEDIAIESWQVYVQ